MEDQGVAIAKHKGVWIMYIDGQQVFFIYEDGTINDICRWWLADAILQRFEAITKQGGTTNDLPTPENLPEPTYIVESPKEYISIPTEQWVFEEPQQFVSIPVTEWQQLRQSLTAMQAILFNEIQPVEFES